MHRPPDPAEPVITPSRERIHDSGIGIGDEAAVVAGGELDQGFMGKKFPMIAASWKLSWDQVIPFSACGLEIQK